MFPLLAVTYLFQTSAASRRCCTPSLVGAPLLSVLELAAEYWSWTREASVVVSFGLIASLAWAASMSLSKAVELLPPPPPNRSLKLKPPPPVPTPRKTKLTAKIKASPPNTTRTTRRRRGVCRSKSTGGSLEGPDARLSRAAGRRLGQRDIAVRRRLGRPAEHSRQDHAALVEQEQRHRLDQHRDRIGAGQQRGDDDQDHVRVAAVLRELLWGDDPEAGHGEDPDRQLEDQAHDGQGQGEEAVVVLGPDLDVELALVEVEEELGGSGKDYEVAEDDAGDEQKGHAHEKGDDDPLLAVGERGQDEGVRLVEDHRQRDDERRVGRDRHCGRERLGDPEGDRRLVPRQRRVGDVEQPAVLPEAEAEGDAVRDDRDDYARTKLAEMFDERKPVLE